MKYLKYILAGFALLVVVLLSLGFMNPTLSYNGEITIDKPIEECWAVSQDEAKLADWLPGFQKIEHISGTPGAVGSVSKVYFDDKGEKMVITETITDIKPKESISMKSEADFMNMNYDMKMTDMNGKTKITSNTTVEGNGIFSKTMIFLMSGMFKKQETTNLTNLKKAIEQNTKNYYPPTEVEIVE